MLNYFYKYNNFVDDVEDFSNEYLKFIENEKDFFDIFIVM